MVAMTLGAIEPRPADDAVLGMVARRVALKAIIHVWDHCPRVVLGVPEFRFRWGIFNLVAFGAAHRSMGRMIEFRML